MVRDAVVSDVDFLVDADLEADGEPKEPGFDRAAHRAKTAGFVGAADKGAWIYEVAQDGGRRAVGMIMARFRDPEHEPDTPMNRLLLDKVFASIDPKWSPSDGRFTEVFQLWVLESHRRRGIATRLKRHIELETRRRGIGVVYTHTEAAKGHVIALNEGLGYAVVRRGTLWDDVVRVSLIKLLR